MNHLRPCSCSRPKIVSWSWPKVTTHRSMWQCTQLCSGHNSSSVTWTGMVLSTIVVHRNSVCQDLSAIQDSFLYPPANKVWGVYRNHPVCPSVHIVSGPLLCTPLSDLDIISHNCCPWLTGVSWSWPKVISPRSRSQCTHTGNLCPGHNSSLPSWIWIIFHTIVVHDPGVCHDLDPRSYLQGHSAHILEIVSGP